VWTCRHEEAVWTTQEWKTRKNCSLFKLNVVLFFSEDTNHNDIMYCKKKTIHFGTKTKVTRTHELAVSYAKIGGSGLNDRWFTASPLPCTLSTPALSTPASLCRLVHCRVLHSRVFSTPINMHYSKKNTGLQLRMVPWNMDKK